MNPFMEHATNNPPRTSRTYLNAVLTVIAVLLAMQVVRPEHGWTPSVQAEPGEAQGLVSAADQRKQMILALANMGTRLDKIEALLSKGIKVSEMPELKLPADLREAIRSQGSRETDGKLIEIKPSQVQAAR
jgi:hypothetical protein